jgi:hypothetical protein
MFVRYFVEVPLPAAQVERALLASHAEWLSAMAGAAQERGDGLLADLELGSLGEDRTQLAISARYRPPLGAVGQTLDRVLLHRVAEATVKDFLDRVGEAITNQTRPAGVDMPLVWQGRGELRPEMTSPTGLSQPGGAATMPS